MSLKDQIENIYPLTPLQKGLLFHSLYEPESGVYFEQFDCRLEGAVCIEAVKKAWQTLINRHPILRTAIVTKAQTEPVQIVFRNLDFKIAEEDWRGLSNTAQKSKLAEFLAADKRKGFVLNRPPLMRVTLIRLTDDTWQLVWSHHHLILDGWSWPILLKEFLLLHKAFQEGTEAKLPPVRPYGDFIAWLKRQNPQAGEEFWRKYMHGFSSATPLLMINKNQPEEGFRSVEIRRILSPESTALLQKLAQNCSVTLNTVIQGAWAILLNRYSRNDDIVYGITVAGRPPELPDVEGMIGPFINTLALRILIDGEKSLDTWLQELQAQQAQMRQFEHTSLSDIQSWSDVPRGQTLFESLLAFENFPVDKSLKATNFGLSVPESSFTEATHYPLTLVVIPGEVLSLKLSYNGARFDAVAMELLLEQFYNLLINMANHAKANLASLSLLLENPSPQQEDTKNEVATKTTLREIFAQTVSRYSERIALTFNNQNFTYQQIDQKSNQLARYLQKQGITPEKRVVICGDRTPDLIIAMLAVVKAGGVYVPVDPSYPSDRIQFTISDCQAELILTTTAISPQLPDILPHICLDAENAPYLQESIDSIEFDTLDPDAGAYIIYTSGSTGQPKGVLVTQHNVTRLFSSTQHWYNFNQNDVWTFFHSYAFDFSVWEIWGALLHGGKLVIVPYQISRNPESFLELIRSEKVTVLNQTPSAFAQLLAVEANAILTPNPLRYIIFGGEALNLASLRPWFQRHGEQTRLVNMYGITETTVHVTYRKITQKDVETAAASLIGEPIPDLNIYIIDNYGNLLPPGVIGEIYISGDGVARGYLNRPELTATKFITANFHGQESRLYRSGDLGRFLPNGDLEYLGRIDYQVKIRGFRIEIGEIETAISQYPVVQETLVLVQTDETTEEKYLIAYLVCEPGKQPTIEALRHYLQQRLPDYMIPAQIVYLDKFPLTANGKIDRKALPKPEIQRENLDVEFVPPTTATEEILAKIWQQVLNINQVGRFDNYFVLGGDSIRSIRVASLAQSAGLSLKLEQIFTHPVLAELAALLDTEETAENSELADQPFALVTAADKAKLEDIAENAYPLAQLQAGMLFHGEYSQESTTYHDVFSFRLKIPVNIDVWQQAYEQMFTRHPILKTAFYLSGFSEPIQAVLKTVSAKINFTDLTGLTEEQQNNSIQEFISQERLNRFDYTQAPLIRFNIHLLAENVVQTTVTVHHAILDGWSLANFLSELTGLYLHLLNRGVPAPASPPTLPYSRFIALEKQALADSQHREFWQNQLSAIPFTKLPRWTENKLPSHQPSMGKFDLTLADEISQQIKSLSQKLGIPLKTVLLAIHAHILGFCTGESEIVTGLVSNGRPAETDSDRVLGLFLNTLPLRLQLPSGSWVDLITATWQAEQAIMPYRRFPLVEIQRLHKNQNLFESSFNFVHFHVYKGLLNWREVELISGQSLDETSIPFAVSWNEEVASINLSFNITYDRNLFTSQQIATIGNYYHQACQALVKNPQANRETATLITESEQQIIFRKSASHGDIDQWVHEVFTQQAANNPQATAVVCEGQSWTYAELNQKSNQLARFLSNRITLEQPVGICLDRSLDMICALLAVLKAGGCYIPIDPQYPAKRIQTMLEDANISLLLTRSDVKVARSASKYAETVYLDESREEIALQPSENLDIKVFADNIAYIIFTSGSTGRPKAIAISHQALAHHQTWFINTFAVKNSDVILQKTPFSFDASVWEFWTPLMTGGKLVLAKTGGHQDPAYLVQTIQQEQVTLLQLVPSLLEILLAEPGLNQCASLRLVFSGGEALKKRVWQEFEQTLAIPLVNLYGPAETTIDVAYYQCGELENPEIIPIGQAVDNTNLYILNQNLQPVPVGTPGELFVGGSQIARGYWNANKATAEKFLPDPFTLIPGSRMYRTGDLARFLPDGRIEFLGRIDHQVKIRGFRIETNEITTTLEAQPGVVRAITKAVVSPGKPNRLVAYLEIPTPPENWQKLLRFQLSQLLPDYMIPALFIRVETWPLLPNGKIDLNALPAPEEVNTVTDKYIAPENEIESILANLWQQVLQVPRIGTQDNFFELGGDSILCLQIIAKAREFGFYFTPQDLFQNPQISTLAKKVKTTTSPQINVQLPVGAEIPLTPIQNWFFQQNLTRPEYWNQAILLDIKPAFTPNQLQAAVNQIAKIHPAFRLRFRQTPTGWQQFLGEESNLVAFDVVELTANQNIGEIANQYQSQLNLENGTLFQAVYFSTDENQPDKLLLIIHHLIVDGVSWRVILQNLATALTQETALTVHNVGFPQWANYVQNLTENWQQDLSFWTAQTANDFNLPLDFAINTNSNSEDSAQEIECTFTPAETHQLLQELPRTQKARIQEALLAVLVNIIADWTGKSEVLMALESHGREGDFSQVDITDAVGWFTSLYPCKFSQGESNLLDTLAKVKTQLGNLPHNGFSYGILSQKSELANQLPSIPAGILFNYLGQFDESLPPTSPFSPAVENSGLPRHPENQRCFQLEITSFVAKGQLHVKFGFSRALHQPATIQKLADNFTRSLQNLLTLSQTQNYAPTDFPLAGLTSPQLNTVLAGTTDVEDIYPLSPVQEGILFHTNFEAAQDVYLQQITGEIDGNLDINLFKASWEYCIQRHPSLRASFVWRDLPKPLQRIHRSVILPFIYTDWREFKEEINSKWSDLLTTDRQQNLGTETAPLMRMNLVRIDDQKWRFIWTHHHLLIDGWSLPLVFREVVAVYQAQSQGQAINLPQPPLYRDFIAWLQKQNSGESFWKQELNGLETATSFGLTNSQSHQSDYQSLQTVLDAEIYEQLKALAQKNQVTVNTLVQAAWGLLLSRYSGSEEVVFGVTVSGRTTELSGFAEMVGLFINTLPLRLNLDAATPFGDWLRSLRDRLSMINQYSHSRLVDIQGWSDIPRGESLFESIVIYENYPVEEGLRNEKRELDIHSVQSVEKNHYPVSLYALPGKGLTLTLAFGQNIGTVAERENLLHQLQQILTGFVLDEPQYLGEIELLSPDEKANIINMGIGENPVYPPATIHSLFSQQAAKTPNAPAVLAGETLLTYAELEYKSSQVAQKLIELGVTRESLVGVCLHRNAGLLVALLGILKAGAAYLPLDPTFPSDRLSWMLEDSQAGIVITEADLANQLPIISTKTLFLETAYQQPPTLPAVATNPHQLAYIIYTSGSTGRPKGVQIQHQSVVNFLRSFQTNLSINSQDTLVAVTTLSFDIAGLELFLPLISGAKVVIADWETTKDGFKLNQLLQKSQATIMQATPSTWRLLLNAGWQPQNDFCALCGGEALPVDLATSLLSLQVELWNVYGPTETTIWSAVKEVKQPSDALSIGRGIANTSLYILDSGLNPVPVGIAGELYIGGDGLARGYLSRPALTSERFVPHPLATSPGARLYRTGDLARWLPNGEIEFLGRLDYQVKIRGFRIELGEIETVLNSHEAIAQAVVTATSDHRLIAYLVLQPGSEQPTIEALRLYLLTQLPDYMLPSFWVFLDAMPLTPNNKVDRKALPAPTLSQENYIAPRNAIEETLVYIWQEILKLDKVGVSDNFFQLGGHSLLAAQVHTRLRKVFSVDLSIRELFDTVTIEQMAKLLLAKETQAGRTEKIAQAFVKLKNMTPEEKAKLLQTKLQKN
ncbi:MAG TPA: amino acid adenylation domain-containing protein [Nostocaceae cyanobacterium]|nr:amino acid adenylation domain-containing protein [Nostocaceae cyanobacterium]